MLQCLQHLFTGKFCFKKNGYKIQYKIQYQLITPILITYKCVFVFFSANIMRKTETDEEIELAKVNVSEVQSVDEKAIEPLTPKASATNDSDSDVSTASTKSAFLKRPTDRSILAAASEKIQQLKDNANKYVYLIALVMVKLLKNTTDF
jgi:hypothetical protein